ncbi:MAG: hypothetical protein ACRDLC_11300, partial [Actinomycetota bacterium]
QAPPLPRSIQPTGVWWAAAAVVLAALARIAFGPARRTVGVAVTVWDDAVVRWLAGLRLPGLTGLMEAIVASTGSVGMIGALRWATVIALLALRRFRHLVVFVGSFLAVLLVVRLATVDRPRPFGVDLRGSWGGWAMPSRPVAILTATLIGILYTLVPVGRWRQLGKWVATGLVAAFALARIHLGVDAPTDALLAAVIAVAVSIAAYRLFVPNEIFPVTYRRGRSAHLDVGGRRGEAIRQALADQLGLTALEVEPFGLSGSAGSTPLRIQVQGEDGTTRHVFGKLYLIDVFFAEIHPSPWRQAVDLANMMLCLALRSSPELVYQRALRQFSVEEISEGFAATRGLAMPSQLRHMLREKGRDLHAEFLGLLPERPTPISVQRWTLRRFGLALSVLLVLLVVVPTFVSWAVQTDRTNSSLLTSDIGCSDQEALWLMAQAVPEATLVPCVELAQPGWSLNDVKVGRGFASIVFDTDRPHQIAAVTVDLAPTCDLNGAAEVSSEQPGARRYIRIDRNASPVRVTRTYVFPGGCISERFTSPSSPERLAADASSSLGFVTRDQLAADLARRSDGRLHLDP